MGKPMQDPDDASAFPKAIRSANEQKSFRLRRDLELLAHSYERAAKSGEVRKLTDVARDIRRALNRHEPVRTFVKLPDQPLVRL